MRRSPAPDGSPDRFPGRVDGKRRRPDLSAHETPERPARCPAGGLPGFAAGRARPRPGTRAGRRRGAGPAKPAFGARAGRERRGAGADPVPPVAGQGGGREGARAGRAPAGPTPAADRRPADPARHALQRARGPLEMGGQPDRLEAGQRLLHARREDRLLQRNPRHAEADRRRDRDRDGPRDRARAARARPRTGWQDPAGPGADHRRVDPVAAVRLRRPGRPPCFGRGAAHDAQVRPRRRSGGRSGRHGHRGASRLRPARRHRAVGEDGGRLEGPAARMALHAPVARNASRGDPAQPAGHAAALRAPAERPPPRCPPIVRTTARRCADQSSSSFVSRAVPSARCRRCPRSSAARSCAATCSSGRNRPSCRPGSPVRWPAPCARPGCCRCRAA